MSLFAPEKMSLSESKNSASKSRRLKDSSLANTLVTLMETKGTYSPISSLPFLHHLDTVDSPFSTSKK